MSEIYPQPVAGQDYPQTWSQFLDWFHSEEACLDYLERLRWPKDFICQRCGVIGAASKTSRHRLVCQSCKHQTSVTAGTIFDKTRTPLKVWLAAAWYITNQKHGVSALGLQRVLGLGSYQTAWAMLHRFRRAMVRPGRDLLSITRLKPPASSRSASALQLLWVSMNKQSVRMQHSQRGARSGWTSSPLRPA